MPQYKMRLRLDNITDDVINVKAKSKNDAMRQFFMNMYRGYTT
jgi:hypothetical protein